MLVYAPFAFFTRAEKGYIKAVFIAAVELNIAESAFFMLSCSY